MLGLTNATDKTPPTNVVTIDTAQEITGAKTFTSDVLISGASLNTTYSGLPSNRASFGTTTVEKAPIILKNASNSIVQFHYKETANTSRQFGFRIWAVTGNNWATLKMIDDGQIYVTVPYRTYSSSNTSDVVTIGSLQASTDVVHTTGNETIAGVKVFTKRIYSQDMVTLGVADTKTSTVYMDNAGLSIQDKNNVRVSYLVPKFTTDNKTIVELNSYDGVNSSVLQLYSNGYVLAPYRTYNASNTTDIVTIGSLQASTDVVHRSGDETIAGNKTFTNHVYISNAGLQVSAANYANIFVKDTNSVLGDKVSAEYGALIGRDSNDYRMAECRFAKGISGTTERIIAMLRAYHPTTPTTSSQTLQVIAYDDGTGAVLGPSPIPSLSALRNITISQSTPTGGNNGDIWIQY